MDSDLSALYSGALWGAFAVTLTLGYVSARSRFCTMGAIADIVNFSDWTRARMWLVSIGVAVLGTHALAATNLISFDSSVYSSPRLLWLSHLVGGFLFGLGMVLASGCGAKSLLRAASGNLKGLVVAIVFGVFAFITLKGALAIPRVSWLDSQALQLPSSQTIVAWVSTISPESRYRLEWPVGITFFGLVLVICAQSREFRRDWSSWLSATVVGLCIVAAWYWSGVYAFVPEDPLTLEPKFLSTGSRKMEAISYAAPMAETLDLLLFWSDSNKRATWGVAAVLGLFTGGALHALIHKQFRWEGFAGLEDTANHLVGAALMGVGSVVAIGCTYGNGLSGLSVLSFGALISTAAIVGGARMGLMWQTHRIEKAGV